MQFQYVASLLTKTTLVEHVFWDGRLVWTLRFYQENEAEQLYQSLSLYYAYDFVGSIHMHADT